MEKKRAGGREGKADKVSETGRDSCVCQHLGELIEDVATFLEGVEEERVEGRVRELVGRLREAQSNITIGKGTSQLRPAKKRVTPPKLPPPQDRPAQAKQGKSSRDQMKEAKSICSSSSAEEPNYLSDEESEQNLMPNSKSRKLPFKTTDTLTALEPTKVGILPNAVKNPKTQLIMRESKARQNDSSFDCSSDENDTNDMKKLGSQPHVKSRSRPPPPPSFPPKSKVSSHNKPKKTIPKHPPPPPSSKSHKSAQNKDVEGKAKKKIPQHGDKSFVEESSAEEEAHYEQSDDGSEISFPIPRAPKNQQETTAGPLVGRSSAEAEGPRDNVPTISVEEEATCDDNYDTMYSEEIPEEDEIYESLMNQEMKKRKVEGRTEVILSVPGVGVISSAKILNASADHLGWLWRKQGFLRSNKKCWALIYQSVLYVYSNPQDEEPQEQIELDGIFLTKINKNGFSLNFHKDEKEMKLEFKAQGPEKCVEWIESIEEASLQKLRRVSNNQPGAIKSPQNAPQVLKEEDDCELIADSNYDAMYEEEPSNRRPSDNNLQEWSVTNKDKQGKTKYVQLTPNIESASSTTSFENKRPNLFVPMNLKANSPASDTQSRPTSCTQQKPGPPPPPPAPPAAHTKNNTPHRPNLKGSSTLAPTAVNRSKSFGQADYSQLTRTERKSSTSSQMDFGSELAVKLKKRSVH